jgi:hypothetical protein
VDEQAVETEPIAEVRADLAALGVDPARAVTLARRLAASAASPAVALLGKIGEAEDDDDEIRRFERADIAAIRQDLHPAAATSAVAHAERAAGRDVKVVPLAPRRRSRRLLYGLSGVAAALAASLVLIVGLSTQQPSQFSFKKDLPAQPTRVVAAPPPATEAGAAQAPMTPPAAEPYGTVVDSRPQALPAQSADSDAARSSQPAASLTDSLQSRMQPAGNGPAEVAGQTAAAPATPQQSADAEAATRAKSEADEKQAAGIILGAPESQLADRPTQSQSATGSSVSAGEQSAVPRPQQELADAEAKAKDQLKSEADDKHTGSITLGSRPESQPADAPTQTATSAATRALGESNAEELRGGALANQVAAPFGINRPIVALLIVDPKLVPSDLKQENYPAGDLSARLADARRLAGNRPIAALVTVQLLDRPTDAVVVAGAASESMVRRDIAKTAESSASSAAASPGYDILLLDRR